MRLREACCLCSHAISQHWLLCDPLIIPFVPFFASGSKDRDAFPLESGLHPDQITSRSPLCFTLITNPTDSGKPVSEYVAVCLCLCLSVSVSLCLCVTPILPLLLFAILSSPRYVSAGSIILVWIRLLWQHPGQPCFHAELV